MFTCTGTFLTIAYISNPTRNCHNNSQLRWDLVWSTTMYIIYNFQVGWLVGRLV